MTVNAKGDSTCWLQNDKLDCSPCWCTKPREATLERQGTAGLATQGQQSCSGEDEWNQPEETKKDWREYGYSGKRFGIHFPRQFYAHDSSHSSIHDDLNSAGVAEQLNPEMEKALQLLEFGSKGDICFTVLRFDFLSSELNPKAEAAYFLV